MIPLISPPIGGSLSDLQTGVQLNETIVIIALIVVVTLLLKLHGRADPKVIKAIERRSIARRVSWETEQMGKEILEREQRTQPKKEETAG